MNMDIQQQNYFFVNATQRWYIFFIKSITNLCELPFPFFLQTAIYSEHQNAWLARLQVMLIYPICIAFDSNGEMIVVGVNKYVSGMVISNDTVYGLETTVHKTTSASASFYNLRA